MKNLFKLFIAMLAVCGVACEQFGGTDNGSNGGNGDEPNTPGTSESVFNITVSDITSTTAYVSVETTSNETYYFDVIEKDYFDQYSDKSVFLTEMIADLKVLYEEYGYTFADALSYGNDSFLYDGNVGLDPNTHYYAFAVAINENGEVRSDITLKAFKTLEATTGGGSDEPSNNSFAIAVSDITSSGATVAITPSNSDTYYFDVIEKDYLDYYTDKKDFATEMVAEIKDYYESYGYTLADALSSGNDSYSFAGVLDPNTTYYALAFGVTNSGTITTDITTVEFTTLESSGNTGDKNLTCFELGYYENWGDYYGTNALNWYIDLYSSTTNDYFVLELQGDLSDTAPVAGEYELLSTFAAGTAVAGGFDADGYIYGTYWGLLDDSWESFVDYALCTSGTVKVGKSDNLYTIDIDAVGEYGESIKVSFAGVLEEWVEESSLSAQKLSKNLNKRFCTVSRMMKQKQLKMAPKSANKVAKLAPKKVVIAKPAPKMLVKKSVK